jgi:HK97 family phage prohead protease
MNVQHMTIRLGELKLAAPETGLMSFSGYGAAFNNVDSYGDVIAPGAFAQFLSDVEAGKQPWPAMLSQHGAMGLTSEDLTPIGAWQKMGEDGKGLALEGDLAKTQRGTEMHTLMSMRPRPAIDGLSIGYIAKKWDPRTKPEDPRRTLREIVLLETSPVTFPANRNARVASVKSIEELFDLSEAEDYLKSFGLSKTQAVAFIARVKGIGLGNPEGVKGGPGNPETDIAEFIRKAAKSYR